MEERLMRFRRVLLPIFVAASAFISGDTLLLAQSAGTGALTGTVTDPSGGVVPNVSVLATNTETSQSRSVITGTDGNYRFTLLPPGTYKVRFSATGFRTAEVASVSVNVTETQC
jgi:hypothetical protein